MILNENRSTNSCKDGAVEDFELEPERMTNPHQPKTFQNLQAWITKLSSTSNDQRAGRNMVGCDSIELITPGFNIILLPSDLEASCNFIGCNKAIYQNTGQSHF